MKPPPALEVRSLNHWTTREFLVPYLLAPILFKRPGFNSWVGKSPWRRQWQPPPVFLPRESHGQRSLAGYSDWTTATVLFKCPNTQNALLELAGGGALKDGEDPAEALSSRIWSGRLQTLAQQAPGTLAFLLGQQPPAIRITRLMLWGGGSSGLGPILRTVVSGLSNGTASCFIKSLLLARKTVCLLCGQGPNIAAGNSKSVLWVDIKPGKNRTIFQLMKQYFSFFFQAVLSRVPRCTFCLRRTHANLQAGCGWSPPPLPLLPLSHSSFLSPPPEPHPGLPGLPSPQPPGRHPERREAQTWPEAIYRVGVGRGGKPTALCIFGVWKVYRIPPFPRKLSFAGFQK